MPQDISLFKHFLIPPGIQFNIYKNQLIMNLALLYRSFPTFISIYTDKFFISKSLETKLSFLSNFFTLLLQSKKLRQVYFLSSLLPLGSLVRVALKSGAKFIQRCTRTILGLWIIDYQPRYIVYQLSTIDGTLSSDKSCQNRGPLILENLAAVVRIRTESWHSFKEGSPQR